MGERRRSGRVKALVIEFSRAGRSGFYLPYRRAEIKEGETAIFSSFHNRSVVVSGPDELQTGIRDGVVDVTARIEDKRLILIFHSLTNQETRVASQIDNLPNATYVIDEENDSVFYGTIGTDPDKLAKKIRDFGELMPRPKSLNKN